MNNSIATKKPLISVVIATRNEVKHIGNIIDSLLSQTYNRIEIIVVDNSTDTETQKIAKAKGVTVYDLSSQIKDTKGIKNYRGYQVNYGVKRAKGEIIFFPDADMTFDNRLLEEIAMLSHRYDALYVPEIMMGKGLFGKVRNFERSFYNQTPIDAVRVVRRRLYEKVGGYDEKNIVFGADDWDLTKSIKKATNKIGTTLYPLYHHEERLSWKTSIQKKKKYSNCFTGYVQKWGNDDVDVKMQLGLKYRYLKVFLENGKWKKVIKHPALFLLVITLKFIVGLNYLIEKRSEKKEKALLIIGHVTDISGPVQTLSTYLSKNHDRLYEITHPLYAGRGGKTEIRFNGLSLYQTIREWPSPFSYLADIVLSLIVISKYVKNDISTAIAMDCLCFIPLYILKIFRIKRINKIIFFNVDYSNNRFNSTILNSIYKTIDKFSARNADYICCNTQRTIEARLKEGVAMGKIIYTPNGVFINSKINKKNDNKIIDNHRLIYVGAIDVEHGICDLCQHIIDKNININLSIVGSGDSRIVRKIQKMSESQPNKITYLGRKSHEETINLLKEFSGFGVAPYTLNSDWVKYCDPVKIKEYLSLDIPVIVSDVPEIAESVNEKRLGFVYKNQFELLQILKDLPNLPLKEVNSILHNIRQFRDNLDLNKIYQRIPLQ